MQLFDEEGGDREEKLGEFIINTAHSTVILVVTKSHIREMDAFSGRLPYCSPPYPEFTVSVAEEKESYALANLYKVAVLVLRAVAFLSARVQVTPLRKSGEPVVKLEFRFQRGHSRVVQYHVEEDVSAAITTLSVL